MSPLPTFYTLGVELDTFNGLGVYGEYDQVMDEVPIPAEDADDNNPRVGLSVSFGATGGSV